MWCGGPLDPNHNGVCPSCGKEGKNVRAEISETIELKSSLAYESRHEFWKKDKWRLILLILIVFGSPFLGFYLSGLPGVIVGLVFATLGYFLGPNAIVKVIEIVRGDAKG